MAASRSHILGLMVVAAWLAAGCAEGRKIDADGGCILNADCTGGSGGSASGAGGGAGGSASCTSEPCYFAMAQVNSSNQITYASFNASSGTGSISARGGDAINKPSWCPYNVWSVWVGGNCVVLSGVLPDDMPYPVYLVMNGIGTVNESTNTPDTYMFLSVNGTTIYDSTQAHLTCCSFTDWSNAPRITMLIDGSGNSPGGMARGRPYSIAVGASSGGTTRICINALQISNTTTFEGS